MLYRDIGPTPEEIEARAHPRRGAKSERGKGMQPVSATGGGVYDVPVTVISVKPDESIEKTKRFVLYNKIRNS